MIRLAFRKWNEGRGSQISYSLGLFFLSEGLRCLYASADMPGTEDWKDRQQSLLAWSLNTIKRYIAKAQLAWFLLFSPLLKTSIKSGY